MLSDQTITTRGKELEKEWAQLSMACMSSVLITTIESLGGNLDVTRCLARTPCHSGFGLHPIAEVAGEAKSCCPPISWSHRVEAVALSREL